MNELPVGKLSGYALLEVFERLLLKSLNAFYNPDMSRVLTDMAYVLINFLSHSISKASIPISPPYLLSYIFHIK